jgi:hypothetical protein
MVQCGTDDLNEHVGLVGSIGAAEARATGSFGAAFNGFYAENIDTHGVQRDGADHRRELGHPVRRM